MSSSTAYARLSEFEKKWETTSSNTSRLTTWLLMATTKPTTDEEYSRFATSMREEQRNLSELMTELNKLLKMAKPGGPLDKERNRLKIIKEVIRGLCLFSLPIMTELELHEHEKSTRQLAEDWKNASREACSISILLDERYYNGAVKGDDDPVALKYDRAINKLEDLLGKWERLERKKPFKISGVDLPYAKDVMKGHRISTKTTNGLELNRRQPQSNCS